MMSKFLLPNYISFFLIGTSIVFFSLLSVISKDIKKAIFFLFFSFFSIAGLYIMLFCEFMAIMQVIIYVGAILVMLVFASMFIDEKLKIGEVKGKNFFNGIVFSSLYFFFVPYQIILYSVWSAENGVYQKKFDVTRELGKTIMDDSFLLYELGAFILLLALIGASYMINNIKTKG